MFSKTLAAKMGLTPDEVKIFSKLNSPTRIQDYLDTLIINFEMNTQTHRSPRRAIQAGEVQCIEAACIAATALWLHGHPPLLLDLTAKKGDWDHVVALYKVDGYWGSISKSNHAVIRFRDAVYKSVRELSVSYFHEWFPESTGERTLRSYSTPLNMKKFGTDWVTSPDDLWWLDRELDALPHSPIAPPKHLKSARRADPMEIKIGSLVEYSAPVRNQ